MTQTFGVIMKKCILGLLIFLLGSLSFVPLGPNRAAALGRASDEAIKSVNQMQMNAEKRAFEMRKTFSWADPNVITPILTKIFTKSGNATLALFNGEVSKKFENTLTKVKIGRDGPNLKDVVSKTLGAIPGADQLALKKQN